MESTLVAQSPTQLIPEAAVAARAIRNPIVPLATLRWLAAPTRQENALAPRCRPAVVDAIDEIMDPLLESASAWDKQQLDRSGEFLGELCSQLTQLFNEQPIGTGQRLLAASWLPLYRCLATGEVSQGLEQTRHRLFEAVVVMTLCRELGSDMIQLFELSQPDDIGPHETVAEQIGLDLITVGSLVRRHVAGFNPTNGSFEGDTAAQLSLVDQEDISRATRSVPDWADPALLWRLSGELIAQKSDLVLPRAWIDTPVPWNSIIDHWNKLSHLLADDTYEADTVSAPETSDAPAIASAFTDAVPPKQPEEDAPSAALASDAPAPRENVVEEEPPSSVDDQEQAEGTAESSEVPELLLPKVLIAEVMSHNDPAFVNLVRRQLTSCRVEARSIALVSIVVSADDATQHSGLRASGRSGVARWQQKLVNSLAEHPDVHEPFAFITADKELWLCVLDLERNDATNLLRDSLDELLGGGAAAGDEDEGLAAVQPKARYFAGISSTGAPNAGLTPEELIESTCRCLSAASRQNKATIKSIEVF